MFEILDLCKPIFKATFLRIITTSTNKSTLLLHFLMRVVLDKSQNNKKKIYTMIIAARGMDLQNGRNATFTPSSMPIISAGGILYVETFIVS